MHHALTVIAAAAVVLSLAGASNLHAGPTPVLLDLTPPSDEANRLEIGVGVGLFTDSDVTDAAGTIDAELQIDASGGQVTVTGLTLHGADLAFSDVSFRLALGVIQIAGSNLGGTVSTDAPPTDVTGEAFDGAAQQLTINRGVFDVVGLGDVPSVDIAELGFGGPGDAAGRLAITKIGAATYEAELTLPLNFSDQAPVTDMDVLVDFSVAGALEAVGQFTVDAGGSLADADGDGDVDGADFLTLQRSAPDLLAEWQRAFGVAEASAAAVPEPTAPVLAGCCWGLLVAGRRRGLLRAARQQAPIASARLRR